ncbi:SLC34A2, partial [Symbiodinium pilosum]
MAHAGERIELERAFSGATVHDMFNMLSVAVLLPEEVILGAITGEGGLLTDVFVDPNKDVTKALSLGAPKATATAMPAGVTGCPTDMDCSNYFCISSAMSKNWKKVDKTGYANLQTCSSVFPLTTFDCGSDTCYMEADKFYTQSVEGGIILDEGLFSGL